MALLPESPLSLVGLALILGGLAVIVLGRTVPKAYALGVLVLAISILQVAGRLFFGGDALPEELGFRSGPFLAGEQWWAPLTYMFVHADLLHLVGNMLLLLSVGPILEDRLGAGRFLGIYLGTGALVVSSHLLMTYVVPIVEPWQAAIGASGALFAILTVLAYHWPRERVPIAVLFIIWLPSFFVLMIHLVMNVALMFSHTNVAWYGHFAGFLLGLGVAVAVKPATVPGFVAARLPDPEALAPLATTPALKDILQRLRETSGTARDDAAFADAWLDRFFAKAKCPGGHALVRDGYAARCAGGEYEVRFAR